MKKIETFFDLFKPEHDNDPPVVLSSDLGELNIDNQYKLTDESVDSSNSDEDVQFAGEGPSILLTTPGMTIRLEVNLSHDTVRDVKKKIQENERISPDQQQLTFAGSSLEDEKMLSDYGITDESILSLNFMPSPSIIQISIDFPSGKIINLRISITSTVRDLKKMLQEEEGTLIGDQELIFLGQSLEDQRTLLDYGIPTDTVLVLSFNDEMDDNEALQNKIIISFFFGENTLKFAYPKQAKIAEVKEALGDPREYILIYGGKIVFDEDKTLCDYKIEEDCEILVIKKTVSTLGLLLTEMTQTADDTKLLKSLHFLQKDDSLDKCSNVFKSKIKPKIEKTAFTSCDDEELMALFLWTTTLVYKRVNEDLEAMKDQELAKWRTFLKLLLTGLRKLPPIFQTVYRGIKHSRKVQDYQKGEIVSWSRISALSKKKTVAETFTNSTGMLFIVEVVTAREISGISMYSSEDEVLLLPHCHFQVLDVQDNPNEPAIVHLREIAVPRNSKVILWVDDQPKNNLPMITKIESTGGSCVMCTSTKDALLLLKSYRWLLHFSEGNFRIITDMVRLEEGKMNYLAGIDLVREIRNTYHYTHKIMIYCQDVTKARENCAAATKSMDDISIVKSLYEVERFIIFDQKREDVFLDLVAKGQQSKAEAMLKRTPVLASVRKTVTDPAKRTFKDITGFQYAVWALDWHMWQMIRKYLTQEQMRDQVKEFGSRPWVKEHGECANWLIKKLTDMQQTLKDNWNKWDSHQKGQHWVQQIGSAQFMLPMHVLQEYSQPYRPFDPCPNFKTVHTLARNLPDWLQKGYIDHSLSKEWALARGDEWCVDKHSGERFVNSVLIAADHKVLIELSRTRTQQRDELIAEAISNNLKVENLYPEESKIGSELPKQKPNLQEKRFQKETEPQNNKNSVIGALLDVSGSMKEKFPSLSGDSLQKDQEKIRSIIDIIANLSNSKTESNHELFALAFGLAKVDTCDLLSLFEKLIEISIDSSIMTIEKFQKADSKDKLVGLLRAWGFSTPEIKSYISVSYPEGDNEFYYIEAYEPLHRLLESCEIYLSDLICKEGNKKEAGLLFEVYAHNITKLKKQTEKLTQMFRNKQKNDTQSFFERQSTNVPKTVLEANCTQSLLAKGFVKLAKAHVLGAASSEKQKEQQIEDELKSGKLLTFSEPKLFAFEDVCNLLKLMPKSKGEDSKKAIEMIESYIYGGTPMCKALKKTHQIFHGNHSEKILFVLSDGVPTDGDPIQICEELKKEGSVIIVSCLITNEKLENPRRLCDKAENSWTQAQTTMFRMSSEVSNTLSAMSILRYNGWELPISGRSRLFAQVNHPDVIKEFCSVVNHISEGDALAEMIGEVKLDEYINHTLTNLEAEKQIGGTCYANATATTLHLAMSRIRIVGRVPEVPHFFKLRDEIIALYGKKGGCTSRVLTEYCPKNRLSFKKVDEIGAREAINARRVVNVTFKLYLKEWDKFKKFFEVNKTGILDQKDLTVSEPFLKKEKRLGHAIVLVRCDPHCLTFINSWGSTWADNGFFRVRSAQVLRKCRFYDVTIDKLTQEEKVAYENYCKEKTQSLLENNLPNGTYSLLCKCPECKKDSMIKEFQGTIFKAQCPKCSHEFKPNAIDHLINNLYNRSKTEQLNKNEQSLSYAIKTTDENITEKLKRFCDASKEPIPIYLPYHKIGDLGVKELSETNWANISDLWLGFNLIGDLGVGELAKGNGIELKTLSLRGNLIGDKGALILASNVSWQKLLSLDLEKNQIGDKGIISISKNTSWMKLSELYLNSNHFGDYGAEALVNNTSWTRLSVLHLGNNIIGDKDKSSRSPFFSSLYGGNDSIHNIDENIDAEALWKNGSWVNLSVLHLKSNKIGNEGIISISKNTWVNLSELYLNNNKIGDDGAETLANNTSWTRLSVLHLGNNIIGDRGISSISQNPFWENLSELYLNKNQIGDLGAEALSSNITWINLKVLQLNWNKIGDSGAEALSKNITWSDLVILHLENNIIRDKGAKELSQNTSWVKLSKLYLSENPIGHSGAEALLKNKIWSSLLVLQLRNNLIQNKIISASSEDTLGENLSAGHAARDPIYQFELRFPTRQRLYSFDLHETDSFGELVQFAKDELGLPESHIGFYIGNREPLRIYKSDPTLSYFSIREIYLAAKGIGWRQEEVAAISVTSDYFSG